MSNWEKTLGLVRFGDGERMRVQYGSDRVCVCAQSSLNFCDPIDCSLPGSSVQGISQARILEWVVIYSSRGSSQPRGQTRVSCTSCPGRQILYHCATWEARSRCLIIIDNSYFLVRDHCVQRIMLRASIYSL